MRMDGLSRRERELMDYFVASELCVVRVEDVLLKWKTTRGRANTILSRLAKKGWLQRLRRGMYVVMPLGAGTDTPAIASPWPIAAELFAPCFISGWSAAEHWGLTDQIFSTVSLVTTSSQRKRNQSIGGIRFRTRTLPPNKVFGTETLWIGSKRVQIADPHRLLIDILDAPDFGGGGRHVMDIAHSYWSGPLSEPDKVLEYARRFGRGAVFKRLGLTGEHYGTPSKDWLQACMDGRTHGISLLDPGAPNAGPIHKTWRIRVNIPMEMT